jgi:hypothetical protein
MRKVIIGIMAVAMLAIIPAAASASVTYDAATGKGFVGKGDVQTAYGWNNAALQANAAGVTFAFSQPIEQSVSQDATQSLTQSVTQSVDRTLSCVVTVGGEKNPKVFHNYGIRSGERTGERSGTREGTRTGVKTGSIASALDGDPRQVKGQKQFTGFILSGFNGTPTTTLGDAAYGDVQYGDPTMGNATMGDTVWSGWQSESGSNPADCDREDNENDGKDVTDISDVTVEGALVEGDIAYGAEQFGSVTEGSITTTGAGTMSALWSGLTKPIWP